MTVTTLGPTGLTGLSAGESSKSAVSWPAVIGGAVAATAVTVVLSALGGGVGLGSVSVWSQSANPSPKHFTALAAIWLVLVQWIGSGLGGYLTGRMRTKWSDIHTHEVFFRDTANGFLSWALASLLVVGLTCTAASSVLFGGARLAGNAAQTASQMGDQRDLLTDALMRPTRPEVAPLPGSTRAEVSRILLSSADGSIAPDDHAYLSQIVSFHTGLAPADADKRVDDTVAKEKAITDKAKEAAENARKATSALLLFTGLSMLIGAFIACCAAALGGRERDYR